MRLHQPRNALSASQTSYWKIINGVMNRCRAPKIPPLLLDNDFVLNCVEKAKLFNDYFSKQCTSMMNSGVLPTFNFLTDKRIDYISIQNEEIYLINSEFKSQ